MIRENLPNIFPQNLVGYGEDYVEHVSRLVNANLLHGSRDILPSSIYVPNVLPEFYSNARHQIVSFSFKIFKVF